MTIDQGVLNTLIINVEHTLDNLLFVATNRCDDSVKKWISQDDKDCDYILTTMTEGTDNPTDRKAILIKGSWDLDIYEQGSASNLDPALATLLINQYLMVR